MKTNISDYTFSNQDKIFFDANILIYLEGPLGNTDLKLQKVYGQAFTKMKKCEVQLYIDILVLSEFINRYLRMTYETYRKNNPACKNYKTYRGTSGYADAVKEVCKVLKKRLKDFTVINSKITQPELDDVLTALSKNPSDFNDHIHANTCTGYDLTMLSHDGDMGTFPIPICSANARLAPPKT